MATNFRRGRLQLTKCKGHQVQRLCGEFREFHLVFLVVKHNGQLAADLIAIPGKYAGGRTD